MSKKGSKWERKFCGLLSLWWTAGEDDSVFWRTAGSGGRATNRRRRGKTTAGQYGDITHTVASAEPFTQAFTLELKKGYNSCTLCDLLDKPKTAKDCMYLKWITKLQETTKEAGSLSWMLIHHRDRREPLVFLDGAVAERLWEMQDQGSLHGVREVSAEARYCDKTIAVWGTRLSDFLCWTTPEMIKKLLDKGY